ncbi:MULTISPECIES: hypothetical protein [Streptosporangium]|uniref:Uncharacterized protein n=1 Tax=Streptosporangium brasiliense TaxID=47480 RepID=A0ABT9R4U3_9ACTN|nr:hypothetical protein [Streptosporangium brasiliense]MDP9864256.1 hypothetical protein [Streptosporangium brasiliense]
MAEIIKTLLGSRKIERYLGGVVDVEGEWDLFEPERADVVPQSIALDATYCDHVLIKYELWDGEPPASDWDESWSGTIHLPSGRICATSCYSGESEYYEEFELGYPDHQWQFRVHRKLLSHEDFTADIVGFALFKLQFWSLTATLRPS